MSRSTGRESPTAARRKDDDFGDVAQHGTDQQERPSGERHRAAREERVPVPWGSLVVRMAMEGDLHADRSPAVRGGAIMVILGGEVNCHRPSRR